VSRKCLWHLYQNDLLLNEAVDAVSGDEVMVVMDLPYAPAESPAAISPEEATVHACMQVGADSQATWAERYVDPVLIVRVDNNLKAGDITNAATSLVEKPGHGSIVNVVDDKTGYHNYRYDPQTGYSGRDRATFVVLISGKTYRVAVDLVVVKDVYDGVNSSGSDSCENGDVEN